ncbi:reverse transcriptase domain-containing protein [Tanacetum coccineum]
MASSDSTFYGERADTKKKGIQLFSRWAIMQGVQWKRLYTRTALGKVRATSYRRSCSWAILMRARASTVENHNVIDACIAGMLADLRDILRETLQAPAVATSLATVSQIKIGPFIPYKQTREIEKEKKGMINKLQIEENTVESLKRDKAATTEKLLQEITNKKDAKLATQKEHNMNALTATNEAKARADARANDEARIDHYAGQENATGCMSTRSTSSELASPFSNPERIVRNRQRNRGDPLLLLDFKEINMSNNLNHNPGPPPVGHIPQNHGPSGPIPQNSAPDLRTMEELCQPTINGRGGPIAPFNIQAMDFRLKNHMIQQVQNICQFHGLPGDDANKHLNKFLTITQSMKQNRVTNDALRLYLFPYSLTHHDTAWFDRLPKNSIHTFEEMVSKFLSKYFHPSMVTKLRNDISTFMERRPEECYDLIENMTAHHNDWDTSAQRGESSRSTTSSSPKIATLTQQMAKMNKNFLRMSQTNQLVNVVNPSCKTCGGPHHYYECQAASGFIQGDVYAATGNYNAGCNSYQPQGNPNQMTKIEKAFNERPQGALPSNTIPNPREDVKVITTRSGMTLAGPSVPSPNPSYSYKELEQDPKTTMDQPPIPYPSRLNKEKLQDKFDIQIHKFFQMFKKLHFNISFAEALAQMPKCAKMLKDLLTKKEKLLELANTPLNENCSAVFLRKLPEKLGDPRKFFIPCDFSKLEECMALADLVGKFTFPADFVVVDYDVDPRVPFILGRPFLRMARALVDHGDESINKIDTLDTTCEDYFHEVLNVHKSIHPLSGSPTPFSDLVVASLSPSLTPFGDSDFLLEETNAFLSLDDSIPPGIDNGIYDSEGDILFLEKLLNDDLTNDLPPLKELKNDEIKMNKYSTEDPPEIELKDLPPHIEYAFLEGTSKLPVIIAKYLKREERDQLIKVLKSHKRAIAWKISDIRGIDPNFRTHKILMEDDFKPTVQHQMRVKPKIHEVIKVEVIKLLDAGLIYPISDSPWVSPVHAVPKKGGMTGVNNDNNELILTRLVMGWRVCIDYRKLNDATRKDHFPLPFMDQMLECLAGNEFYYFLNGFSGYFQIPIDPQDQEKTIFTWPYGTFAYHKMPFDLCNAPGTFQRCMVVIFHDMIEKSMKVFMDDFSVFGDFFSSCLSNLDKMLKRYEDTNLVLNWEKCHFMVKEGILLSHKISKSGIKVDHAKVDVIAKLPPPTTVKGIRSFLGHAGFYRRFIQDFSKIARPMTHLLEKETPFVSKECMESFEILKTKLIEAPILICDKKGVENLAADHLSRLENPHKGDLVEMKMNDNFPHESLNMIDLNADNEPLWFADIANYLVGGVWMGAKLWKFLKLATIVQPVDIDAFVVGLLQEVLQLPRLGRLDHGLTEF